MPPSYRERLRLEGAVLAACGAGGSAALLALVPEAREHTSSTVGQLAFVAVLCAALGPVLARRWTRRAERASRKIGGDPTPLWQLPLITVGLALLVALPTGLWDAGLRVTGGCLLVGLTQAGLMATLVGRDERRRGRRYVRLPGSNLITGTKLGYSDS